MNKGVRMNQTSHAILPVIFFCIWRMGMYMVHFAKSLKLLYGQYLT